MDSCEGRLIEDAGRGTLPLQSRSAHPVVPSQDGEGACPALNPACPGIEAREQPGRTRAPREPPGRGPLPLPTAR